jgi:hypothetical protein
MPVNGIEQGPCQTADIPCKLLNFLYFYQRRGPGGDINQSAFGGNLDDLGRDVTFFVGHRRAALVTAGGMPSTGVVQE